MLIAMKSHYVAEEVELIDISCEVVWAKIVLQNCSPMFVGSFYRPPSDNITSMESFDKSLQQVTDMCRNNTKATIIVAGDYNAGDIDWDLCHVNANSSKNLICQKLIDTFNEYGLTKLQKLPTRGEAILDLFATNKPDLVKSITNIPGLSYDHDDLVIDMDVMAQVSKKPSRKIYKWSKAD